MVQMLTCICKREMLPVSVISLIAQPDYYIALGCTQK